MGLQRSPCRQGRVTRRTRGLRAPALPDLGANGTVFPRITVHIPTRGAAVMVRGSAPLACCAQAGTAMGNELCQPVFPQLVARFRALGPARPTALLGGAQTCMGARGAGQGRFRL